jgi:MFS family permease
MVGGVNNAKDYIDLMEFGHVETIDWSPNTSISTNSLLQGGIVSVYYLGALFGALAGGWIGEKVGRIKTNALGAPWEPLEQACSAQLKFTFG